MFAELLLDAIFDLVFSSLVKMAVIIFRGLIGSVGTFGRVANLNQSATATERRAIDYIDQLLFG